MTEGFCIAEQRNVALDQHGHCVSDGSIGIPPTWGHSRQLWQNGAWSPEIERPEGHRWKAPGSVAQVIADPVSAACQQCDLTFSYQPRGGDAPRYCSPRCKGASSRARQKAERAIV